MFTLILFSCLIFELTTALTPPGQDKPGKCPIFNRFGICLVRHPYCLVDSQCPSNLKCCSVGCGRQCVQPILDQTCPNGQSGICGTIAGRTCPSGTTCMFKGNYPDASGKCCINNPKPLTACTLPLKVGPCRGNNPRYFYNASSCRCERFSWGGCEANANNFNDIAHCQASCEVPMKSNPVCALPKPVTYCKTNWNLDRWYFNSKTCRCEPFKWNGCGNANNFLTKEWCNVNCGCFQCNIQTDICDLPIKPNGGGPTVCLAYIPSYGYNMNTCRCEKFIYSGCGGNANRFSTMVECERRCGDNNCYTKVFCNLQADVGRCDDKITRYAYNTKTCQCEKFIWGGCGGNTNNFKTIEECLNSCGGYNKCEEPTSTCLLPKDVGPCEARTLRYYYDKIDCKCKSFLYGGCGGNKNNFLNIATCRRVCGKEKCHICNLKPDTGPCRSYVKRFFFNMETCQCEEFIYGGCGGNGNNYITKKECEELCGDSPCQSQSACLESKKVGPCKAAIKRFYYNPLKNKCQQFTWGGCEANGNNFLSMKTCNKVCKKAVCTLPVKVGPCKGHKKRYYYNNTTRSCQMFIWGGCESNGNNFKSFKACKKACM
ncbi:papilin-like isoform X2 [Ruditapes philippinarum]|uniref:papilin-like isoform X2 n=1 Tax=Ruditapes philippinarum TaxID=129788 RepID=UPI00295C13BB|nr:papilin-like isoform X2 [Ruditapes philippinarum]